MAWPYCYSSVGRFNGTCIYWPFYTGKWCFVSNARSLFSDSVSESVIDSDSASAARVIFFRGK